MKPYLSPEEASLQLGICPREIRRRMRRGKLIWEWRFRHLPGKSIGALKSTKTKIDKITGGRRSRVEIKTILDRPGG